jgi:hypothetical protein
MKRVVRLTESDLTRIVRRVIKESNELNEIGEFDMNIIQRHGGDVVESVNIGGFELALVHFKYVGYTISLTYNDKTYFKPESQKKQPTEYEGRDIVKIFRQFKPYVMDWIKKYKKISVGSTNKRRVQYYHKWICGDANCDEIKQYHDLHPGEPQYSFTIYD